jgi:hypothetical protein
MRNNSAETMHPAHGLTGAVVYHVMFLGHGQAKRRIDLRISRFESCPLHLTAWKDRQEANAIMAKKDTVSKTEKHLAWIAAEQTRMELVAALKAAEEATDRTASEFGEELKAAGKNGAVGPYEGVYVVQACRKAKGSEEPPPYPYTMRRAQTITM